MPQLDPPSNAARFTVFLLCLLLPSFAAAVTFDVTTFGAVADDGLDDRAAIQAAVDAACVEVGGGAVDVEVYVPPGVFDVEKGAEPAVDAPWVIVALGCGDFTFRGEPGPEPGGLSTIRLADGQGVFESLLGAPTFAQRVDGLTLRDLTLDGNGANNPILGGDADLGDLLRERRHALRVYAGDDVRVEASRFTGWRTVNVVTLNGIDVADATVVNNRFDALGQASADGPDWDHSTVYTDSDGAVIEDNTFATLGAGSFGVRAAIETHGPRQTVRRNRIEDFTTGMNVTGASALGSDTLRVESNLMRRVADGIRLWAFEVTGNTPGEPVMSNVMIRDNWIEIDVDAWRITQDAFQQANKGISLVGASDGVIEDLTLEGNTIVFEGFGTAPRAYDSESVGIALVPSLTPDLPIRGLTMRRNTIRQALATAVEIGSPLPLGAEVSETTILDAGVGGTSISFLRRSGMSIFGEYQNVNISETCVIDTDPAGPRLSQAFFLDSNSLGANQIAGTHIELAGGTLSLAAINGQIGDPWSIQLQSPQCPRLLADGFESGDFSAWDVAVGAVALR